MGHQLTLERAAPTRRWPIFTSGFVVGMAAGLIGVGVAVAAERARRRAAQSASEPLPSARGEAGLDEAGLDEELAQTFPASDPLPHFHRID
jgi:hypothetical protein